MCTEEECTRRVDDLAEWPDVAPVVEGGGELESVEAGADVSYYPELIAISNAFWM